MQVCCPYTLLGLSHLLLASVVYGAERTESSTRRSKPRRWSETGIGPYQMVVSAEPQEGLEANESVTYLIASNGKSKNKSLLSKSDPNSEKHEKSTLVSSKIKRGPSVGSSRKIRRDGPLITTETPQTMSYNLYKHFRPVEQDVPQDHILPFLNFGRKLTTVSYKAVETSTPFSKEAVFLAPSHQPEANPKKGRNMTVVKEAVERSSVPKIETAKNTVIMTYSKKNFFQNLTNQPDDLISNESLSNYKTVESPVSSNSSSGPSTSSRNHTKVKILKTEENSSVLKRPLESLRLPTTPFPVIETEVADKVETQSSNTRNSAAQLTVPNSSQPTVTLIPIKEYVTNDEVFNSKIVRILINTISKPIYSSTQDAESTLQSANADLKKSSLTTPTPFIVQVVASIRTTTPKTTVTTWTTKITRPTFRSSLRKNFTNPPVIRVMATPLSYIEVPKLKRNPDAEIDIHKIPASITTQKSVNPFTTPRQEIEELSTSTSNSKTLDQVLIDVTTPWAIPLAPVVEGTTFVTTLLPQLPTIAYGARNRTNNLAETLPSMYLEPDQEFPSTSTNSSSKEPQVTENGTLNPITFLKKDPNFGWTYDQVASNESKNKNSVEVINSYSNGLAAYILAALGVVPLLLGVFVLVRQVLQKTKKKVLDESEYSSEYNRSPIPTKLPRLPEHFGWEAEKAPVAMSSFKRWEFPREKLRLQTLLGQGNFGQVWKAEADDISGHEGLTRLVAVKTVKEGGSQREKEDLLRELGIMQDLGGHPNVVTLLGCCTEKEPYFLIMEYVMYGKLLTFLREHRTRAHYFNFSDLSSALTSRDLTVFAYCVAKGMEYLASKGIIHRDLAARNVLVDHNKLCKIADFGMSRNVRDTGQIYEQRPNRGALPIRWMAPESLQFYLFTQKADVWSFGVLMWEIITLGSTPYSSMSARELMRRVRDGYRLERPKHCKPELFRVASKCWSLDPGRRPTFSDLRRDLGSLISNKVTGGGYVDLEGFIEEIDSQ